MTARIFSINIGEKKGEAKKMVRCATLKKDFGITGDAHAGLGLRQVSFLSIEELEKAEYVHRGKGIEFLPGIFAENITTEGIDLSRLEVGDRLFVGEGAVLRVEQIGIDCRMPCRIGRVLGVCLMPKKGIFASVETGSAIKVYDRIRLQKVRGLRRSKISFLKWLKI